jgi:hypoxanthine-DNA glycosylase
VKSPAPPASVRLQGLPPLVADNTVLLVLGSFPGKASLRAQQYYAHPQNQFWRILQAIWPGRPCPMGVDSYEIRGKWLLDKGLGLWDVYGSCERDGSLDTAIRKPQVNDFASLWHRCPCLRVIAHNGGESFKHARLVMASLSSAREAASGAHPLPVYQLPSTSPAHASWSFERKLAAWRDVIATAGLL